MEGRLDKITVRLSTDDVTLPWTTREQLLTKLGQHPLGEHDLDRAIRKAFDDVGASSPVTLTLDQKTRLLQLLEQWSLDTADGYNAIPPGLFELRNTLIDDAHDAERRDAN